MGAPDRLTRVNEMLKREIANLLERDRIATDSLVSVTSVDVAPNLRHAKVYMSIFGCDEEGKTLVMRAIFKRRKEIQQKMASHIHLKYTPILEFYLDDKLEAGARVLSILSDLDDEE